MRAHLIGVALTVASVVFPTLCSAETIRVQAGKPREISFELVSGYLIVAEGSIGNLNHLKFVLDTGTTRTFIDLRLAKQLALPLESKVVLRFDTKIPVKSALLPSLTLGPLLGENLTVNVADLSHLGSSGTSHDGRGRTGVHVPLDSPEGRSGRRQCQHRHLCGRAAGAWPARWPERDRRHQP
jgi:hypothetical protein